MTFELPEGITYNKKEGEVLEFFLPYEVIETWDCTVCKLKLEAVLIGENGRHQGSIKISGSQSTTWQGQLPKNREKAVKYLRDTLDSRIWRHKEVH